MRIGTIRVRGFRSLADVTVRFADMTAVVGRNGTGKSSLLTALCLFYESSSQVEKDDFFGHDTSREIRIAVAFEQLSANAQTRFGDYPAGDGVVVERVFTWKDGRAQSRYHGFLPQHAGFSKLRQAFELRDRAVAAKAEYSKLKKGRYAALPPWSTIDESKAAIRRWELEHRQQCEVAPDEGNFFGFGTGADGDLGRVSRLLYVPAVRDARAMVDEGRGSLFTTLLDLVVRSVMTTKPEVVALQDDIRKKYETILSPETNPELTQLASKLTSALRVFVPTSGINLNWHSSRDFELPMPTADVGLVEDGYEASVDRCGHGLQRAFVVAMLQQLVSAQTEASREEATGNGKILDHFILSIEEPELYQHPNRQRHFAHILRALTTRSTPGVAAATQVLYATHSPLFVGIEQIDEIRLLRKRAAQAGGPRTTEAIAVNLEAVAEELWEAANRPDPKFTAASLKPRLTALMTPWVNEGFFADAVVLVEGENDRAALLGTAEVLGHDFEAMGVSVIPCRGKTSLDRPTAIFRQLGIPTYTVWDADQGSANANPAENHLLLRLHGAQAQDWPSAVEERYCCFSRNLETTLRTEIGPDQFDAILDDVQARLAITRRHHAVKNPDVMAAIVRDAKKKGVGSPTLERIVSRIGELARSAL